MHDTVSRERASRYNRFSEKKASEKKASEKKDALGGVTEAEKGRRWRSEEGEARKEKLRAARCCRSSNVPEDLLKFTRRRLERISAGGSLEVQSGPANRSVI